MKYKFDIQAEWWEKVIFINIFKFSAITVIAVQEFWLGMLFLILIFLEEKSDIYCEVEDLSLTWLCSWKPAKFKDMLQNRMIPLLYFYFYPEYFWCYLEKNLKEKEEILFKNARGHCKGTCVRYHKRHFLDDWMFTYNMKKNNKSSMLWPSQNFLLY